MDIEGRPILCPENRKKKASPAATNVQAVGSAGLCVETKARTNRSWGAVLKSSAVSRHRSSRSGVAIGDHEPQYLGHLSQCCVDEREIPK